MTPSAGKESVGNAFWHMFAAITIFVFLFGLTIPLLGPDEPRYAQVAREMFERGDWVTPTLGGFDWFEKPALLYWLQIASYHIFGVNEFAARFGSAIFGLGTIFCLYIFGTNMSEYGELRFRFAKWLALIAATSIGLIVFSRGASFDIILTFPIAASLTAFFVFDERERSGRSGTLPLALFYIFVGVAVLAKGLVGIVFPYAIVSFYYLLSWRRPSAKLLLSVLWGTLLAALVASAWYVPMYQQNGWKFIDEFFIQHHFQRYTSNKYFHPQPFHFFFWVLPLMTIPWLPFFFMALWRIGKNILQTLRRSDRRLSASPATIFCCAWIIVPLVFFSFSGSKLPGYILPALPPCIILAAGAAYRWINDLPARASAVRGIAVATFVVIIAVLIFIVPQFADGDSVKRLIAEAHARGFDNERLAMLHRVSHNAEFYAPGRIIRTEDGKQHKYLGAMELVDVVKQNGPILVLVPIEYRKELVETAPLATEPIADNGEFVLARVTLHQQ